MQKFFNLLAVLLTVMVLSASSAYAGNKKGSSSHGWHHNGHGSHSWTSWFSGWGPGKGWGWGHFKWGSDNDNNNGCERSNSRSNACNDDPDPSVVYCSPWTDFEVQHPLSWETAYSPAGWLVGNVAEFASGATCVINQVSIGGRNDTPTPPPGRG